MKLSAAVWPVAVTFALGVVGLFLPGPAGDVASFVWLGVFPGLALVRLLIPGAAAPTRWTLGVALAPLASTTVGGALIQAGLPLHVSAQLVAVGGWLLFAGGEARALSAPGSADDDAPGDRAVWGWALGAAAFVALPLLAGPGMRGYGESSAHAAIVWEIAARGLPPQDPRLAGLALGHAWYYDLFIALAGALRPGSPPFTHMATASVCWVATQVWLGWQVAWVLWRERAAARASLPLLLTGLNAGTLLLWPLRLLRTQQDTVGGTVELDRIVTGAHGGRLEAMHEISAPFARTVNSWDEFMVGSAPGCAHLLLLVALWSGLRWLAAPRLERAADGAAAWRWLLVAFAAASGTVLFQGAAGSWAALVAVGACVLLAMLAARDSRLGPPSRPLLLAAALLAAAAATWPYLASLVPDWDAGPPKTERPYLPAGVQAMWTLFTACGLTALAAWPGVRRAIAERRAGDLWLVCWTFGIAAVALIARPPGDEAAGLVWQVFAPLALVGGAGMPALIASWRRLGGLAAATLVAIAFVLPSLWLQYGLLTDRSRPPASPETQRERGEPALYAWMREHTPTDAVFLDHRSRDAVFAAAKRRLLAGAPLRPNPAELPPGPLRRRLEVMADLYGPVSDLAGDAAYLDSLGSEAYVLYRDGDFGEGAPWTALEADSAAFARVYAADGFLVYRRKR